MNLGKLGGTRGNFEYSQVISSCPKFSASCCQKRVLILMADAGGGHRAAAEAIHSGLKHLYGATFSVTIVDAWREHFAWPLSQLPRTYSWVVKEATWLWKSWWALEKKPVLMKILFQSIYPLVAPGLRQLLIDQKPDVIISVHPFLTRLPMRVLQQNELHIPFITVVTDVVGGFHIWYHPQTSLCLVPTDVARRQALNLGLPPEKIEVVGQPVALDVGANVGEKRCLRRKLGLYPDCPTVLLAGGGEGYGPIFEIARAIAGRVSQAQLVIVTGRNKSLHRQLKQVAWEIPTAIFGFVDNMAELMGVADVFVTKAGPGSISEAFVAKVPLVLFGYIPGQEEGNMRYVVEHRAGVFIPNPTEIAECLVAWLEPDNSTLSQMADQATHLARPEAALTIARRVYEQAFDNLSSPHSAPNHCQLIYSNSPG